MSSRCARDYPPGLSGVSLDYLGGLSEGIDVDGGDETLRRLMTVSHSGRPLQTPSSVVRADTEGCLGGFYVVLHGSPPQLGGTHRSEHGNSTAQVSDVFAWKERHIAAVDESHRIPSVGTLHTESAPRGNFGWPSEVPGTVGNPATRWPWPTGTAREVVHLERSVRLLTHGRQIRSLNRVPDRRTSTRARG